ncbi:MAG: DUF6807 family protein [Gemmataceae bacterium]
MTRLTCVLILLGGSVMAADPTPVVCTLTPDRPVRGNRVDLPDGNSVPAQAGDGGKLTFVLLQPPAGPIAVRPVLARYVVAPPQFKFADKPGEIDVLFADRLVLRYMNAPRDGTTKDTHELTFKPFHHVLDPVKGETLLTNGAGLAANKDLLYPHHRGLFFAFNRISYDDQKGVDTWHGRNGEYTLHEKVLASEAGEVFARQRSALSWHGKDGQPFADEQREVTTYHAPGGTLIDWSTHLTTARPKVRLDGDPQHAGFHFRAAMEVAKNGKTHTYYLRPDGKGKPGETRNWEPKTGKGPVDLPWDACSFVVGGQRYTVLRVNHPDNPKPARGSEREYGRFGDYFEYDLTPSNPLKLKYRVWVQTGEMTVEQCEAIAKGFVSPPKVTLK